MCRCRAIRLLACSFLVIVAAAPTLVQAQGKLYGTHVGFEGGGFVWRIDLDTGLEWRLAEIETVDIALDLPRNRIYWVEGHFQGGLRIQRATLLGQFVETVVEGGAPRGVAVDSASAKLYWTTPDSIQRSGLGGEAQETVVSGIEPRSIAVDPASSHVFWIENLPGDNDLIRRARLDGTAVATIAVVLWPGRGGRLAVDSNGGKVYWTEDNPAQVLRADLDGGNAEILETVGESADGIALDPRSQKVYWLEPGFARPSLVRRVNFDGTAPELVLQRSGGYMALAIDPQGDGVDVPSTSWRGTLGMALLLAVLASVAIVMRRRRAC